MKRGTFTYLILLNVLTSSHCTIAYIALSMALSYIFSNSILVFSFFTGLYLMSMGIGALLIEKVRPSSAPLVRLLFHNSLLGVLLASPGVILVLIINESLHIWLRQQGADLLFLMFPLGIVLTVCIGIVSGAELPIFSKIIEEENLHRTRPIISVLASDYFGAFVGIMLFTFILNPFLGLIQAITVSQALTLIIITVAYAAVRPAGSFRTLGLILLLDVYVIVMFLHKNALMNFIDRLSAL
mgnify:FL=1